MGLKKQNITGNTPKEIAELLQIYKDTVQIPLRNVSDVLLELNSSVNHRIALVIKKGTAILAIVEEEKV